MYGIGIPVRYTPPRDRVARVAYNRGLSTLNEHLVIPSASNTHFTREALNECLLYLSAEERYAESGLEDLGCTREVPSSDDLLYRLKKLKSDDAHRMLMDANDAIIKEMKRRGVFRKPVIAAIDLTDDPYYGEYNNRVRRSRREAARRAAVVTVRKRRLVRRKAAKERATRAVAAAAAGGGKPARRRARAAARAASQRESAIRAGGSASP